MNAPTLLLVSSLLGCVMVSCNSNGSEPDAGPSNLAEPVQAMDVLVREGMNKLAKKGDVYLAGQPSPQDLAWFDQQGVGFVINLRKGSEMNFDEEKICADLGMTYAELPWNGADELTDEVFDAGRSLLESAASPVLLHCASSNRVGPIWMAWQVLDRGADLETATQEAKLAGMRTPAYESMARDYIARKQR
ncbi:MAG: hypothetical protein KDB61_11820 [Planctomycetes bacterium]|nr:hypothetical protein [Planctomycetota bacterium]